MNYSKPALLVAILAAAANLTTPAFAKTGDLVLKVQDEAAWQGVEVDRIRRHGQTLTVTGQDRQGRTVALTMSCEKLGYVCEPAPSGRGFAAVSLNAARAAGSHGVSVTTGLD